MSTWQYQNIPLIPFGPTGPYGPLYPWSPGNPIWINYDELAIN